MDCSVVADATEFLACGSEYIQPILDSAVLIVSVSVLIAIVFAGLRLAKRIVREFGR
jgi:hypothetical protein